ncbi:MAG TPA: glutathione S-transferase family protein [bacterium]
MSDLILHHYDTSPYAEKARLIFGLKGLPWKSVVIPLIMPKPDLMPLTGGYRRTPVMQIGADVYCDTECIAAEIERRHPTPTLFPGGSRSLSDVMSGWVASALFPSAVGFSFSTNADRLPIELLQDRHAMRGVDQVHLDRIKAAGPRHLDRLRSLLAIVDGGLSNGKAFLSGNQAGLVDFSLYHSLWFVNRGGKRVAAALEPFKHAAAWMQRVAAIGHGQRAELPSADALKIAKDAKPAGGETVDPSNALELKAGDRITVTTEDTGRDPTEGTLVGLTAERVTIRRNEPSVGEVAVHFPRVGYAIRKL